MLTLAILLTVHNRKAKTLACLESVFNQKNLPTNLRTRIFLVDDGCSDGTAKAVDEQFPDVTILKGTGKLFWSGGMRMAFGAALEIGFDFYLWLNDDTFLFTSSINRLLATSTKFKHQAIVVASMQDPQSGQLTYGGVIRLEKWHPIRFTPIAPSNSPIPVETMNGNCVLIPQTVAQKVGNIDPTFTHGIGDYDYGLRARQFGIEVFIAPGYYGHCKRNIPFNYKIGFRGRWKQILSPHGLPPKEWIIFVYRYGGPFWFVFWFAPYLKIMLVRGQKWISFH